MRADRTGRRAGFTLLELLIAGTLSVGLTLITAQFWGYFSSQLQDLKARARVAQELRFAMESIAQDMGAAVGATPVGSDKVLFCKDGGQTPNGVADWGEPDSMVTYSLVDGQLVRENTSSGGAVILADNIADFLAENVTESVVQITIRAQRGDVWRQVTLLWSKP